MLSTAFSPPLHVPGSNRQPRQSWKSRAEHGLSQSKPLRVAGSALSIPRQFGSSSIPGPNVSRRSFGGVGPSHVDLRTWAGKVHG